jgi:hypothetical protein
MTNNRRQLQLKIAAGALAGLFLLDHFVFSPAIDNWNAQSERVDILQKKVERGRQVLEREDSIRNRWAAMLRANLPSDLSTAGNEADKAVGRWAGADSQVTLTSMAPQLQWQSHDEGFDTLEYRVTASGNQASLGRFIYEMETDPIPVNLEEFEFSTRDVKGAQLTFTGRMTFLHLNESSQRQSGLPSSSGTDSKEKAQTGRKQ